MDNQQPNQQKKQVQLKASDEVLKGFYANAMITNHTKEELILDFLSIFGQNGTVGARIITSPGHFKRMIKALEGALKKYEENFGEIKEAEEVDKEIGFRG